MSHRRRELIKTVKADPGKPRIRKTRGPGEENSPLDAEGRSRGCRWAADPEGKPGQPEPKQAGFWDRVSKEKTQEAEEFN